jgi:hypothetical protein
VIVWANNPGPGNPRSIGCVGLRRPPRHAVGSDAESPRVLPKNPMREAVDYARSNWTALNQYAHHGHLAINNNAAKRALWGIAIGRRNWTDTPSKFASKRFLFWSSRPTRLIARPARPGRTYVSLPPRLPTCVGPIDPGHLVAPARDAEGRVNLACVTPGVPRATNAGWSVARFPRTTEATLLRLPPLLGSGV